MLRCHKQGLFTCFQSMLLHPLSQDPCEQRVRPRGHTARTMHAGQEAVVAAEEVMTAAAVTATATEEAPGAGPVTGTGTRGQLHVPPIG